VVEPPGDSYRRDTGPGFHGGICVGGGICIGGICIGGGRAGCPVVCRVVGCGAGVVGCSVVGSGGGGCNVVGGTVDGGPVGGGAVLCWTGVTRVLARTNVPTPLTGTRQSRDVRL